MGPGASWVTYTARGTGPGPSWSRVEPHMLSRSTIRIRPGQLDFMLVASCCLRDTSPLIHWGILSEKCKKG